MRTELYITFLLTENKYESMVNVLSFKVDIFTYYFFQYPVYATLDKSNKVDQPRLSV